MLEGQVLDGRSGLIGGGLSAAAAGATGEDEGAGAGERDATEDGGLARAGEDAHVAPCCG